MRIAGGVEPTDRRVHSARFMRSSGVTETALYLYPRIYSLHDLTPEDCFANAETMQLVVPPNVRASFAKVEEGAVYLVDNGQVVLLWLHAQVSPNLLEDLFGEGKNSPARTRPHDERASCAGDASQRPGTQPIAIHFDDSRK